MKWYLLLFPSCHHCKYFKPSQLDIKYNDFGLCTKYNRKLGNKTVLEYAEKARQNEKKCGITGKDFENDKRIKWFLM